jgi:hypothetical protein
LRAENESLRAALAARWTSFGSSRTPVAIGSSFEEARSLDVNERYLRAPDRTRSSSADPYEIWTTTTHPEDLEMDRRL